jgi:hypothetical protein
MTEETQELDTPQNPEPAEAPEITETPESVDTTPTLEDYNKLADTKKQLSARLAKAEAELKKAKAQPEVKETNTPTGLTREEAILIAKGTSEVLIEKASLIAKAQNISLLEAMKDPLIEAFGDKLKADEKKAKASLGASSGGSGNTGSYGKNQAARLEDAVGMSEEEHRKAIGF